MTVRQRLLALQDLSFRDFQASLIPNVPKDRMIGVRTPALRKLAKEMTKEGSAAAFLARLPHEAFEEDQLHAFLLSEIKDYHLLIIEINRFLPFVNNWATCDQLRPKCFQKHRRELLQQIRSWLRSTEPYTVRFAIGMLMMHYLEEDFSPEYLQWVAEIRSREYYVNMMIAWYFATALAKQPEAAVPYLTENRLPQWVHNKTIQKAVESCRIPPEQKMYLKTLKR